MFETPDAAGSSSNFWFRKLAMLCADSPFHVLDRSVSKFRLIALNFAECRFTVLREEFGDAHAGVLNDPLIEVDVPPPNLAG